MGKGGHYLWVLAPYLAQVAPGFDLKLAFLRETLRVWAAGLDAHTLWQPFVSTALGFGLIMSHPKEKVSYFFLEGKGIRPSTQNLVMVELYQIFHPCGMYELTLPEPS